jgi:3-oxoacyl-[acyl-carrier protein] reductase
MISFAARVALVSGGSRGIGRATSVMLGSLGATVAVHYAQDEEAARSTVDAVAAAGGHAFALRADLRDPAQAQHLVEQCVARAGALHVLVVNHGIWKRAPLADLDPARFAETLDVNLASGLALCRAAAAVMADGASMVTVASTAGQRGEPEYAHYAASKGGIMAMTRSLAAELAPRGIRVNCVAPGWVYTDMTRATLDTPAGQAMARARIPVGRPATPEEIAAPIVFLASSLASYTYGEVLCVNGGAVMVG